MSFTALILVVMLVFAVPYTSYALMPPDLLFSVGASIVQFFSIAAVVVGGLFSTFVFGARRWFSLSVQHVWLAISVIVGVVLLSIAVVYLIESHKETVGMAETISQLESANVQLEGELQQAVPLSEHETLLALLNRQASSGRPVVVLSATGTPVAERQFYSDTLMFYGIVDEKPFALEIDFNRLQTGVHSFTHYTFIDGSFGDDVFSYYDTVYATTSALQPNLYVRRIEQVFAQDRSPRDTYRGTVLVAGEPLTFEVSGLQGDFITRHRLSYTQYQSVGVAQVTFRGSTFTTQVLAEGAHAHDYSERIFFPGRELVDATTHQFILWDEQQNFYLIDISDVRSDTPQYPSHVWLLFKEAAGGVRKSFAASVETETDVMGRVTWRVTAPEFTNATMELSPVVPFKQTGSDRVRTTVGGVIVDEKGERSLGGLLHLVE